LVVDGDGTSGLVLKRVLENSDIDARYCPAAELPDNLARLMDSDAVILVNTDCSSFSYQQQEMLCRYVTDLGGGLVMVGGSQSFGAGGWIGSPVAEILPVDLDPPQKKELPKGALVMIMHSCEMPQGNLWGERIAIAAVKTLSRLDLVGILAYNWQGTGDWVFPLSKVGDKQAVISAIKQMQVGDMPDLGAHLQAAYDELKNCEAAQKHVIIISDGDPQPPTTQLLNQIKQAGITCTGVAVFPHSPADVQSLLRVAKATGGRFYNVKDPQTLPQIFIKEAQVVRRSFIIEETFSPQLVYSLSEITKGLSSPLPNLDGYVLTGPKGGLNQVVLTSHQADPILATCQSGLGRCVAFTSSVDSRWASSWLAWAGSERFWEQTVRWAAKPAQSSDCEVLVDVQGRQAGQFQGQFQAAGSGSYVVNLRYRKLGEDAKTHFTQTPVTVPFAPEFRDLSDNTALLAEVSRIAGGRVLSSDPNQAELFDYAGLKFPETQLPVTRLLMLIWLAVFLLDVAVRRIALDIRAVARRIVLFVRYGRAERKTDKTIERLRLTRKRIHDQLTSDTARRYEADERYVGDLPTAQAPPQTRPATEEPRKKTEPKKVEADDDQSHIQQLLRAKRKAADRREDDKMKNSE
jgi:uncharacterized membrane protein